MSRSSSSRAFVLLGLGPWLAPLGLGCGKPVDHYERYVPEAGAARRAIDTALTAWKEGRPPGTTDANSPKVRVVDSSRKAGQRLKGFEVLGEVSSDRSRGFAVRLALEDPEETQVARFLVVGIEPLWVFRQEDYEMISHWEHAMPEPDEAERDGPARE